MLPRFSAAAILGANEVTDVRVLGSATILPRRSCSLSTNTMRPKRIYTPCSNFGINFITLLGALKDLGTALALFCC